MTHPLNMRSFVKYKLFYGYDSKSLLLIELQPDRAEEAFFILFLCNTLCNLSFYYCIQSIPACHSEGKISQSGSKYTCGRQLILDRPYQLSTRYITYRLLTPLPSCLINPFSRIFFIIAKVRVDLIFRSS